ncbi:hypothetical protein EJ110_NYTH06468 [Nymphaea thermarum]|nr:hypothetical protein EJ110_NYTH06468 [Nymphaea thermarum]
MVLLVVLPGLPLARAVWKVLYMVWWKPLRIQSRLRKQGIYGPSFQLFFRNARETMSLFFEAWSKPMSLSHDISYHVAKEYVKWVKLTAASGSCELDVFAEIQTLTGVVISKMLFGKNEQGGQRLFDI